MRQTELAAIAARYTLRWRHGHLSSFLSLLSILGLVLAVALLVLVLSVMNGFDREMRENILSLVPQLTVRSWQGDLQDPAVKARINGHPQVLAAAPFIELQGMLIRGIEAETALFFGISPPAEERAGTLTGALDAATWSAFAGRDDSIILGSQLASQLELQPGDTVTLIVPRVGGESGDTSFAHLSLVGTLDSGTELDESAAFLHLSRAAMLAGSPGQVDGYRLHLHDLFSAPRTGWEIVQGLPPGFYAQDWTQTHGNLYAAIQMSRRLVGLLLLSIIAVAAFNVVSSLVLVVMDKRADIAILRALGASPADINGVFMRQGVIIAILGAGLGSLLGILVSLWITDLVGWFEAAFDVRFLNTDVYPIGYLPADLRLADVLLISGAALGLCFLATLYPARRAALTPPAEALRHE